MTGKILFISSFIGQNYSGGSVGAARNLDLCKKMFPDMLVEAYGFSFKETPLVSGVNYLPSHKSPFSTFLNYCFGNAGSVNFTNFKTIIKVCKQNSYQIVFLDGSLLGKLSKHIKKIDKRVIVIAFFHNVERHFFLSKLTTNLFWLPLFFSASYNERLTAHYADFILCFNNRDATGITKYYNKYVNAIIPVTVTDKLNMELVKLPDLSNGKKPVRLLFIGSDFYANVIGIQWFVNKVMPYVNATLTIAGKGMERYEGKLANDKVVVLGTIDDINKLYYEADIVVAPVFSGSGMKIKTAESLMMGKTLLATDEAWQGYIDPVEAGGAKCNNAAEFIDQINWGTGKCIYFNQIARKAFENHYSHNSIDATISRLSSEIKLTIKIND